MAKKDDYDSDFALLGLSFVSYSNERILDYGCSYYMCRHGKWFSNFEELDGGVVHIGNDDWDMFNPFEES